MFDSFANLFYKLRGLFTVDPWFDKSWRPGETEPIE